MKKEMMIAMKPEGLPFVSPACSVAKCWINELIKQPKPERLALCHNLSLQFMCI